MQKRNEPSAAPAYLGIEAGATRTVAVAQGLAGGRCLRMETGPANLRLIDNHQLTRHFRAIAQAMPSPAALGIGMAGARTEADWERIRQAAARVWPGVPCYATNDLETALMAAEESREQEVERGAKRKAATRISQRALPRVLVLSGTGSCCYGRTPEGKTAKVGGWGHLIGDKGSGYEIGLRALKAVVYYYDRDGKWPSLGGRLLRELQLNEPNNLIGWVQQAGKQEVAGLAVEVFEAWAKGDRIARDILAGAAHSLAKDAASCARRLVGRVAPVQFVLAGSVLLKQPRFTKILGRELKSFWPKAVMTILKRESVQGALALARNQFPPPRGDHIPTRGWRAPLIEADRPTDDLKSISSSPTEQRNPHSMHLDKLPLRKAVALMLREDASIPRAVLAERKKIEQAVRLIVRSFRRGGRLFYFGAGTSGRLGVLDASECPPTFRTPPDLVQGIIAGGQHALWEAVEGAEDDPQAGARAVEFRNMDRRDLVVGITASGRTPFVWGALGEAKRRGATTVLLCFNPHLRISGGSRPDLVIAPNVGPEILTGSTRLKSGTATKLILNIFTTLSMVRLGKVLGNLMVDVHASNSKLRDRAVRIVQELTRADYATAQAALKKTNWRIKPACAWLKRRRQKGRNRRKTRTGYKPRPGRRSWSLSTSTDKK